MGKSYNKLNGGYYSNIVLPFLAYGIREDNIRWVNYFEDDKDSSKDKIDTSDIIFFTGGFPDKIMSRLAEFDLINTIEHHQAIIMGWSAGAMMQCYSYYISPDKAYRKFRYEIGLNCIKDFAVEVHYKNTEVQNASIKKNINETGKNVYTTEAQSAIIADGCKVILLGNAKVYKGLNKV
ncbi:Type 1 glutamine amidotransferase-like domain-containing protein [Clostridium sp. CF012]|uniref:Type 1 glutamine amidotransferase-like domain-containing protein n=1 Tax=Clostridium sp. CF012 TaxID=2843319 RepID=UPI001C0C1B7C|nr:Type 1 glutamine amidotransferase-like domain-containing protein [Clostridium sp. CF012]MBU3143763.1 Type 1 glutamine amidotransferase-like domain-containing protein [Clostridium sp. CF012]